MLSARVIFATIMLLVGACQHDRYDDYDYISDETGIRLDFRDHAGRYTSIDIEALDRWYKAVEDCVGMSARPGPLVVVVMSMEGRTVWDQSPNTGSTILAKTLLDEDGVIKVIYHKADTQWVMKHEFIHYILLQAGVSNRQNKRHDHEAFGYCEYLI